MSEKQYNSDFCPPAVMPKVGSVCPKCGAGEIRQSQFFEGVYCSNCRWQWRKSKWADKKTSLDIPKEKTADFLLMEEIQGLRKHLDERLDNLGRYLKEKLEN